MTTTTSNVLTYILEVFTAVGNWISTAVTNLTPMFYNTDTGLTFMGILAVAGLAFSVVFLVLGIIQNFLHFRG